MWPFTVRDHLPAVAVPLTPNHPDVTLDLQIPFTRVYDEGMFDRSVEYRGEPEPPLSPADGAWADALLREAGFRP